MQSNDTIAAVSTAVGTAALGIIRITGEMSFDAVSKCIVEKNKFIKAESRKIMLQLFKDNETGEIIDEITIIKYKHPYSFTGEDMVEIICHGGKSIIQKIFEKLRSVGIRSAAKGEFSKRAFLNGKIDLMKAEAINAMIASNNNISRKIATRSYQGGYSQTLEEIKKEILSITAEIEAEIEFAEEDDIKEKKNDDQKIIKIIEKIEKEIDRRKAIKEIENGIKVVIAGPANAGKSTLFNKILGYERSIIYDEPGTTRDIITEKIHINDEEITLTDSAGIRKTDNEIEKIGIDRSIEEVNTAQITIWISAINEELKKEEKDVIEKLDKDKTVVILNKYDLKKNDEKENFYKEKKYEYLKISLKKDFDEKIVINKINEMIRKKNIGIELPEFITNFRHEEITEKIIIEIKNADTNWKRKEIAAFHLHNALDLVEELFGKRDREEVYNKIFSTFCVGK